MKPYEGSITVQGVYEVLVPFKMRYPYKIVKKDDRVENKNELFPEEEREQFIDEAEEFEIGTGYKLRPVIIIHCSEVSRNTYLAIAVTKRKQRDSLNFTLAVCNNEIKERHFLAKDKYPDTLRFDSFVLIDNVYLITEKNIYYRRGRLFDSDYAAIRAKLKKILDLG